MSQQDSEGIVMEYGMELDEGTKGGPLKVVGVLHVTPDLMNGFVEFHANKRMTPLDMERALYQIAHCLAEQTRTGKHLTEAKSIWT